MIGFMNKIDEKNRLFSDLEFVILNGFVNKIPVWYIRKKIYQLYGMTIHKNARIGIGTVVYKPEKIEIGARSVVNEYCYLDGRGGLKIGYDVSISMFSKIITASHIVNDINFKYREGEVVIHDHVWIGIGGIVLDGSTIGARCVIGAGCVVKGILEENSIIKGVSQYSDSKRIKVNYKIHYSPFFR